MSKHSSREFSEGRVEELKALEIKIRDAEAEGYDQWLRRTRATAYAADAEARTVLSLLKAGPTAHVLDAGCGTGRLSRLIAERVARVTAVDYSPVSVAVLQRRLLEEGVTNVQTIVADLNDLPVDDGPFDAAICVEVIQHIPTSELRLDAMRRLRAVLKGEGQLVVVVDRWGATLNQELPKEGHYNRGVYRFAFRPRELAELLDEVGFCKIRVRGLLSVPERLWGYAPSWAARMEPVFAAMPWSVHISQLLVATAAK